MATAKKGAAKKTATRRKPSAKKAPPQRKPTTKKAPPKKSATAAARPRRTAPNAAPPRKAPPKAAAGPKRKTDSLGRSVPAKRAPGAGRKKSTALRQHYTNTQPCRRSEPELPTAANAGLSGAAPKDLGRHGKFLWQLLVDQQADCEAKGITPTVGMESYALAHQYASAFDRWAEVKKTIRHLEEKYPAKERHLAKWKVDDDGNWSLHGVWETELKFRKEAASAAKQLGIGPNHPAVALQVNNVAQTAQSDSVKRYVGPYREAAKSLEVIDVTDRATVM